MALTSPTFNAQPLPDALMQRWGGSFQWIPPSTRLTSNKQSVLAGLWSMTWRWQKMDSTAFAFWTSTVLAGAATAGITMVVWNQNGILNDNLTTYSNVRAHYPIYRKRQGGYFWEVTCRITHIITGPPALPAEQFFTVGLSLIGGSDKVSGG